MGNAASDALLYKDTVFVPEMGVIPVEKQERPQTEPFVVEKEVCRFIDDENLRVLLV